MREGIASNTFDPQLFDKGFRLVCSLNMLKLLRREPSRFFEYQEIMDKHLSLGMRKSGKNYFDQFEPITSVIQSIKNLEAENRKVILLILDGLGFFHFYLACLELLRQETSPSIVELCHSIIESFNEGKSQVLSSCAPTLTAVNHISLCYGTRLLCEDSFLIKATDDSFFSNSSRDLAQVFHFQELKQDDRKSWARRLEESGLQRPTELWSNIANVQKTTLFISANSENSLLSYLIKGCADFRQVDSYSDAIEVALKDKTHELVISQVNLMDAFLHGLNSKNPPALINDVVNGYWAVYLDLVRNILVHVSKAKKSMDSKTTILITADHGMALGQTTEFCEVTEILQPIKEINIKKGVITELFSNNNRLIGACLPGYQSKRFLSIFLLKEGLAIKDKIRRALEVAQQENKLVFEEILIAEEMRNIAIKPDFLVFPVSRMFGKNTNRKYYGGIHGGISMCEILIPLVRIER
jgi:hypothetical protein